MFRYVGRLLAAAALTSALLGVSASVAVAADQTVKTTIWLDGEMVRTILPPSSTPNDGTDAFFMVPGTGGVAAVGPGDVGYHGGHWAVYVVSWNVAQYPLTSYDAILAAEAAGDVSIARNAAADFLCPIQGH